jgi:release factor glutamine methyltransferase
VAAAARQIAAAGNPTTARLDAQVLLAHLLGVERSWLFACPELRLTPEQLVQYSALIARRCRHEPVAYLTGYRDFYGLTLAVDSRVLIETELLVEQVLHAATQAAPGSVTVADVGTGSGAIAVAVATHAPNTFLYALDNSRAALAVAHHNVAQLRLEARVRLVASDLLASLPVLADIVVANLPYVTSTDYLQLDRDVRDYEPPQALVAGPAGLDLIERLLTQLPAHCRAGCLVALEIGYNQGKAVQALVHSSLPGATQFVLRQDYQGHDRIVTFRL